jgi:hypothetical protein
VGGGVDLQVEHETRFELAIHTWPDGQPFVLGSMTRKIERARKVLPLSAALRITRLSASRHHGWCLARRSPSSARDDHPVARRNESVSSCSHRQLFQADLVVDTRGTARQWRDLSDPSAFHGQTPNEELFGIGDEVPKRLAEARALAREKRMKENRAVRCGVCVGETTSEPLLLQRARSRML